jgi:hypothetical protein
MFRLRDGFVVLVVTGMVTGCLSGCLANPATGIAPNGSPLRVQYSTGTGSYVANEKTGESVTTYSDGTKAVTEHYTPVQHSYRWTDWRYFQGGEMLDEQDYYRIAGDDAAARQIEDIRNDAALKMKIGVPLMIVGAALELLLPTIGQSSDNTNLSNIGYLGGSVVGLTGALLWYWGHGDMAKRHHLPQQRADERADVIEECNEGGCTRQPGGRRDLGLPAPAPR